MFLNLTFNFLYEPWSHHVINLSMNILRDICFMIDILQSYIQELVQGIYAKIVSLKLR